MAWTKIHHGFQEERSTETPVDLRHLYETCIPPTSWHRQTIRPQFWFRRLPWKRSLPLFSLTFGPGGFACATQTWHLQCVAGHCYYHLSVFLSSFFSPTFPFDPLWGNFRSWKFVSPNIFGITRRYIRIFLYRIFIFIWEKNTDFCGVFFFSLPAFGHGCLGHP